MRKLDHKIALEKIRRDSDTWIRDYRQKVSDLHRKEEALSYDILKSRMRWASQDATAGRKAFPLALATKWQMVHFEAIGHTPADEVALVPIWRRHVQDLARDHRITVEWAPIVGGINGYAMTKARRIECAEIQSGYGYATVLHEIGHCVRPCEPSHRRVVTDEKRKESACVACELSAWRWAISQARPRWTRRMHDRMATALPPYRPHGTPDEQREIDELVSGLGFRRIQSEQLRRTA